MIKIILLCIIATTISLHTQTFDELLKSKYEFENENLFVPDSAKLRIQKYEGFRSKPYKDASGKHYIVGYGMAVKDSTTRMSKEKANNSFDKYIKRMEERIKEQIHVPLTVGQFSALADMCFNMGTGKMFRSKMVKLINDEDYFHAGLEIKKYIHCKGKVLRGLVKRRNWNYELWTSKPNELEQLKPKEYLSNFNYKLPGNINKILNGKQNEIYFITRDSREDVQTRQLPVIPCILNGSNWSRNDTRNSYYNLDWRSSVVCSVRFVGTSLPAEKRERCSGIRAGIYSRLQKYSGCFSNHSYGYAMAGSMENSNRFSCFMVAWRMRFDVLCDIETEVHRV